MPEENMKVVVTNAVLPVEATIPVPVTSAQPLEVTGVIDANIVMQERGYEYKIFNSSNNFQGFFKQNPNAVHTSLNALESLEKWYAEGWEIHYEGRPVTFNVQQPNNQPVPNSIIVLRRPK